MFPRRAETLARARLPRATARPAFRGRLGDRSDTLCIGPIGPDLERFARSAEKPDSPPGPAPILSQGGPIPRPPPNSRDRPEIGRSGRQDWVRFSPGRSVRPVTPRDPVGFVSPGAGWGRNPDESWDCARWIRLASFGIASFGGSGGDLGPSPRARHDWVRFSGRFARPEKIRDRPIGARYAWADPWGRGPRAR